MAQIGELHWQVEPGQNWASIAATLGVTRNALLACNGEPSNPAAVKAGRIIHIPFVAVT